MYAQVKQAISSITDYSLEELAHCHRDPLDLL